MRPSPRARRARVNNPAPTILASNGGFSDIAPAAGGRASKVDRPPYVVPTLAEIAEAEPNGLTVASTFAGAGGSSTGWEIAGYRVRWANEFHPPAADSYARNHPATVLDRRDIRKIDGTDIVNAVGQVDVLDGSPPCQDFSMAGKRASGWGEVRTHGDGTTQRSDDLFWEYTRLLGELRPRAFVAENVKGLVIGVAKGKFKQVMADLKSQGYRVKARVLDAQWLGVPQHRQRVIIVGIRDDLGLDPVFPTPLPYRYSMLDACPWLSAFGGVRAGDGFNGDRLDSLAEPVRTMTVHGIQTHNRWQLRRPRGQRLEYSGVGQFGDTDPSVPLDEPISTITAHGISAFNLTDFKVQPAGATAPRKLTIAEAKRLCSFPDDYWLAGGFNDQWARLGNSVPPLMMAAVARALAPLLLPQLVDPPA